MNTNYPRWQTEIVEQALKTRRVLVLAGPRQCGKTTLAQGLSSPKTIYRSLDDDALMEAAQADPREFVRHGDELMIIDEVQRVPALLRAVKQDVDENQAPGRFLLTGSANIQSLPGVTESLAGRMRKVRLRPLTMGEICRREPTFISNAFEGRFQSFEAKRHGNELIYTKNTYIREALKGGYPKAIRLQEPKEIRCWYRDYSKALLERDLKDIAQIKRKDSMAKLLEVLAAWSSKFMDISSICKATGLSRPTVESYINALEALYLVERARPWHKSDYDRIGKQEKLFMTDGGLMASILRWQFGKVQMDGERNGKLVETFVFNQLAAILEAQQDLYQLYHYRDREKREIDFIIENEDGAILAIEVKAGSAISKGTFKQMQWFRENLAAGRDFKGIVLYTGENILSFGKNLWAVPISSLWA